MRSTNTPGLAGYLLGVCVSDAVCGVLLLIPAFLALGSDPATILALAWYAPFVVTEVAVLGLPVAIVGVLLLEVLSRRVGWQVAHVAVAAGLGFALTVAYARLTGLAGYGPRPMLVALAVSLSAGAGRASVVPMVRTRRRLASDARVRVP